ncbi:YopX family protein [Staphylococcus hominis]|uniref:YopX family protein n=1 Tax=Staphylococcus hominis TaxID=1290 RepID=UPI00287A3296|nr:YopX family protein [Staphylococcus hominis]MDS3910716.1 YopX family protein [Staphylococcus hominis]
MIPKFRAWNKVREEMIDDCDLSITSDGSVLAGDLNYDVESGMLADVTDNVVIMMSTRLKDKNGTEIYEGDIVKNIYDEIYVVKWLDAGFYLEERYNGGFDYSELHFGNNKEVIGNIYENPELLEDN